MKWRDYSLMVYEILGEELISLGLIKNNTREEVRRYFPHGISHSLGLDVHDVCEYETIRENMIITVEPGIYIPEEGLGVRIEDNVLITKQGAINLSSSIRYE
jgi:Xaa-Pro aminopeptidase